MRRKFHFFRKISTVDSAGFTEDNFVQQLFNLKKHARAIDSIKNNNSWLYATQKQVFLLKMSASLNMLKLMRFFKNLIKQKHEDGMIPRIWSHSTVREVKLKETKVVTKEEEILTSFHDKVTSVEHSFYIFQCDSLDKVKIKLNSKLIRWDGHKQACNCDKTHDTMLMIGFNKLKNSIRAPPI